MKHEIHYTEDALNDMDLLDNSQRKQVKKAIFKVSTNPLPKKEGGYGNPLGNKGGTNLTGLMKIKLLKLGIRVVYQLIRVDKIMKVIVIAARSEDLVYKEASKRITD